MSQSAAFDDLGYNAEGPEDVSFGYVPGSVGPAHVLPTPWTARRRAEFDAARARCMPVIEATLSKFKAATRPRPLRAPVDTEAYERARERVLKGRDQRLRLPFGESLNVRHVEIADVLRLGKPAADDCDSGRGDG